MIRDQSSVLGAIVPCSGSVAVPENEITCPTLQVVPALGLFMLAVGGALPA